MIDVLKAAEFLDSKVGTVSWLTADWRSKINLRSLKMDSVDMCILGQLQGNYDEARHQLDIIYPNPLIQSFCGGTREWINYLKGGAYAIGTRLWGKADQKEYIVRASYELHGKRNYVLTSATGTAGAVYSEDALKQSWTTEEPKRYRKGDILALKGDNIGVYVLVGDHNYGVRIGNSATYWGRFSGAPMDKYTRYDYDIIGNVGNVSAAGIKF